jgi:hypothetical protein
MSELELRNDLCRVSVSREGLVEATRPPQQSRSFSLQPGQITPANVATIGGLQYYSVPCPFQFIQVRLEGSPKPLAEHSAGSWPMEVDDDMLETYPALHFLEERKTAAPWRLERWYTLAGSHIVFESEQYFERSRPRQVGRDWERFIINWRQVINLNGVFDGVPCTAILLASKGTAPTGTPPA